MSQSTKNQELETLADYLLKNEEAILSEWEESVKEKGTATAELNALSHKKFQDNIPKFIQQLCKKLLNEEDSTKAVAKEHGANRWEHGFKLQNTVWEWSTLHKVLMKRINRYEESSSLGLKLLKQVQYILADHINKGIIFSVEKYRQLQQAEAEARLRDLEQALEKPEEFSHSEDLRQTSHDVKGMLHVIRTGFYLLDGENLDKKSTEIVNQMSDAADSLKQLLDDLLDLFRLEAGKERVNIKSFNIAELLGNLCNSYQPMAQTEQLDLRCKGDKKLRVKSDAVKVKRIVQNLVLNSLKYTESGYVEVQWKLKQEDYWMIQIKDTGPGLSTTHAASLTTKSDSLKSLEKSQQATDKNKSSHTRSHGEGIGLLIVRRLSELLDAVIEVKTEKEEGTTYRIIFPVDLSP